ncbi:MAG: type II CAAX prenyl endopeptidase Rce1 family protein [Promethearchaeota archaeon]
MENQNKGSSWFIFSTPAILAAGYLSLQFLIEFLVALLLFIVQLTDDIVISKFIVLIISQMLLTVIIIFVITPFLKIKDVEFTTVSYTSFLKFIAVFCLFWAITIPITLIFSVFSTNFSIGEAIYEKTLPLSIGHRGNLFSVIMWLLAGTLSFAIFMEYLFRRTLIPLFEKRGLSPFAAVITSSIAFALVSIPNYLGIQLTILTESNLLILYFSRYGLLNSLFCSLNLFMTTFILGMACGIVYILTRNVIFSIMVHCLGILPYYLIDLFHDNIMFDLLLGILIIVINISGLLVALFTSHTIFKASSQTDWITILKKKSEVNINRGITGFFITFWGIIINIVIFIGLLAEHAPIIVALLFNIIFLGFCTKYLREDSIEDKSPTDHNEMKEYGEISE